MQKIESRIDRLSPAFVLNDAHHRALAAELRERIAVVKLGGGEEAMAKHRSRGKMPARERTKLLFTAAVDEIRKRGRNK